MTTKPIHEVRLLETAEDLFAAVSPTHGDLWTDALSRSSEEWIFRGQANGADGTIWKLTPSAFRPAAFLKYQLASVSMPPIATARDQREREISAVVAFANTVDRHGLTIPGDSHELRDERASPRSARVLDYREFPPANLSALFALAQHHGVPTRLLDWTWKPLVAIYFAAEAVARRRGPGMVPPNDAPFSVFAVRRSIFTAAMGLDPWLMRVHAPSATNANLHAQGGLFTLVQLTTHDEFPLPDVRDVLERISSHVANRDDGVYEQLFPFLIEFRVPAREARTTLMLLERWGVTAAAIYPGLAGAAKAIEEPRFYQWASPGERS